MCLNVLWWVRSLLGLLVLPIVKTTHERISLLNFHLNIIWLCLCTSSLCCSDRPFIMEIPALPVTAGSDITLRCRNRNGSAIPVHFFKFGRHSTPIRDAPEGEFTISNVQQSDEGFYWCSAGQTTSPSSMLSVRGEGTHRYLSIS